jgi:hypothetical protein
MPLSARHRVRSDATVVPSRTPRTLGDALAEHVVGRNPDDLVFTTREAT